MILQAKTKDAPSTADSDTLGDDIPDALPRGYELLNYVIDHTINDGSFGITYKAHEKTTGRKVVIKESFPRDSAIRIPNAARVTPRNKKKKESYDWSLKNFINEARILSELEHSNIVTVLNAFEENGTAYYVMKTVQGTELHISSPSPSKMNEAWLRPVLQQLLSALKYIHERKLFHRDIKPSNILLSAKGKPLLIDFGLARKSQAMSSIGAGSEGYMPYEQHSGDPSLQGPWTDLYALGATCYRLIIGVEPESALARMTKDTYKPLSTIPELHSRFTADFLNSIDKALNLHILNRWQSAQEWIDELEKADNRRKEEEEKVQKMDYEALRRQMREEGKKECAPIIEQQKQQIANLIARIEAEKKARMHAERQCEQVSAQEIEMLKSKLEKERAEHLAALRRLRLCQTVQQNHKKTNASGLINSLLGVCKEIMPLLLILLIAFLGMWLFAGYNNGPSKAAQEGWSKLLKCYLLLPGINVDRIADNGHTPLSSAAASGHTQCVKELIKAGADINKASNNGCTPLIWAAAKGHDECVRELIKAGSDVNRVDHTTRSALDWARLKGHTYCVELLRNASAL
ncbi:MAG: ankyrin repeat domain-containing protein [Akkermansia sp.]|nr:ankyrin repeat domain-containing protein [Akkermansia sp.]